MTIGDEEPIDCRPADLIPPGYGKAAAEIGHLARSEEDVLSCALLPQVARDFLRRGGRRKRRGLRPWGGGKPWPKMPSPWRIARRLARLEERMCVEREEDSLWL